MSNLQLKGAITHILPIQSGTSQAGKDWQKLDFVIQTGGEYPKSVAFTLFGEKTKQIDGIAVGQVVNVHFNLESREYEGRWFSNINAWKVVPEAASQPDYAATGQSQTPPPAAPEPDGKDLPF